MADPTADTAAIFNAFDNAMMSGFTRKLAVDPAFCTKGPAEIWPILKGEMDVKYPEASNSCGLDYIEIR